jgi:hypothetical protein
MKQFRQGDVFITECAIPKTAKKQDKVGRIVLEHGEVTGHAHAIYETEKTDLYLEGSRKWLELCFASEVKHEEHSTVNLPAGTYKVTRQITWSVLDQMGKLVAD